MPRLMLTDRTIRALQPQAKRVDYFDAGGALPGFALRVTPNGVKTWSVLYRNAGGRLRRLTLGKYPVLGLADARETARKALAGVVQGADPAGEKQARRDAPTFAEVAREYVEHAKKVNRSWREKQRMLDTDVVPVWGFRQARDITARDVRALVDSIVDRGAPIAANRTFALIGRLFTWASAPDRDSIAANGFVSFEPLIVVDEGNGDGRRTVIEGNRRVAAIKLLRDADLAADLGVSLPVVRPDVANSLKRAQVLEVESRDAARQYIGFKHINGPHKWDAFAKGKFAADWFRAERRTGITIRDIAQRLGDRHDTILRLVNGIYVLEQAKTEKLFDISDRAPGRPFFFSHLYTALTRPQYRDYLGLPSEWRQTDPTPNPVPSSHLPKLKQVLAWIYGSDSDGLEPLIKSQNPNIKELGEVLANPVALKRLESGGNLKQAHLEVTTRGKKFEESLIKAVKHAEDAQQNVDAYDRDPTLIEFGTRLTKIGRLLVQSMKGAKESDED